jgi:hypothetical protein
MLGAIQDAEDALFTITTNACIRLSSRWPRRLLSFERLDVGSSASIHPRE